VLIEQREKMQREVKSERRVFLEIRDM